MVDIFEKTTFNSKSWILPHTMLFAVSCRSCPGRVAALQYAALFASLKKANLTLAVSLLRRAVFPKKTEKKKKENGKNEKKRELKEEWKQQVSK